MYSKLNSKGESEVIGNVLLILITLAAAGLVFTYVTILVDIEGRLSPAGDCITAVANAALEIESACYDALKSELHLGVRRSASEEIVVSQLGFVIEDSGDSDLYTCDGLSCGSCKILLPGSVRTYYLPSEVSLDRISLTINNGCVLDSTDVVPECGL